MAQKGERTIKKEVLSEIINYYLDSCDFNGLPLYNMTNYDADILCSLIDEGLIEVLSGNETSNPHIRGFSPRISLEDQKKKVSDKRNNIVLYPTKKALSTVFVDGSSPYSALMCKGEEQFKIIYFNIEILERYANNPKYIIMDLGYRGSIYVKNEYLDDKTIETEYIKKYGMAYLSINPLERAIGVFLRDLFHLNPQKQMLWKSFELPGQDRCKIHSEFIDDLILGLWTEKKVWIFQALLDEMAVINNQCEVVGIPHLFIRTFSDFYKRPEGYRNIFLPTSKNYYDFVLALEKITVSNISIKTFVKQSPYVKCIKRKNETGEKKGSLTMLEEWLISNIKTTESIKDRIISPLRDIREQRQKPAHQLIGNTYDIIFYQKQDDLINRTYDAIRDIRLLFSNHPLARGVEVPEYLEKIDRIVSY